ncbi:MAG: NAD(P)-dependent oxidoreductase [Candidatus Micrarchaeia archaeon]|jgi:D-lactate dehydrogenase
MAKLAFFELEKWEQEYFTKRLKGHELVFIDGALSQEKLAKASGADVLSVFIYSKVGAQELAALPSVKLVATRSTGFDHVKVADCKAKGVAACNVPEYGSETVAEHTMALMLSLAKKIPQCMEKTRRGDFTLAGLRTFDLEGKTVGIVGLGRIGSHFAKMARSFNMKVIAFSPHTDIDAATAQGVRLVGIDELLQQSDIVSLHCPLNKGNFHMINKESMAKMKTGAILINTARGGLVDARALIEALDSGKISGAGLDALEEECGIKEERQLLAPDFAGECNLRTVLADHILLNHANVIITPHNAFNSSEALQRILATTADNIEGFLSGRPQNIVGG